MYPFELPRNLERSLRQEPRAADWLAALPGVVDQLAAHWSLRPGRPFQPGGVTAWVAPAVLESGEPVVLKVGWLHDEARDEAAGLHAWSGAGSVRVLDSRIVDSTSALLLEPCEPGIPLAAARAPVEQDEIVAGLLRRLWIEPAAGHGFRPLEAMCDLWADAFDERSEGAAIDRGLARDGSDLFRSLARTTHDRRLLWTDLHAGNVLGASREPWLAIDPKPYVGDPAYDVLQHMLNCPARLSADPLGFAARMADLAGVDRERVRAWLYARCVLESLDQPFLVQVARELSPADRARPRC
jgi:streptomycin 6-kinase